MPQVEVGDIVRYLNAVGGGRVTRVDGNMAFVDDEGFETPVPVRECVVVTPAAVANARLQQARGPERLEADKPKIVVPPTPVTPVTAAAAEPAESADSTETPYGDRISLTLAFEPVDIKQLSTTTFDTYLVNDSNYYLQFTLLTRPSDDSRWSTRYAGVVEPNIQLLLGELQREDLGSVEHIALQYVAFKQSGPFELKEPVTAEYHLDPLKFLKLHCFRDNIYFDSQVIAIDIVKDDVVQRPVKVDPAKLEKQLRAKKAADRPRRRPVTRRQPTDNRLEVDLHIDALLDNTRGLSAADMLNYQVDEFRRVMDANLKNHGLKIVFIHGKGEGVLRNALAKELNHRYKGHQVQDASFSEYGYGATQVTIR